MTFSELFNSSLETHASVVQTVIYAMTEVMGYSSRSLSEVVMGRVIILTK